MRRFGLVAAMGVALGVGGCGGGDRVVDTAQELPVTCLTKPVRGKCRGKQAGYYYDYRSNRCKALANSGCGGKAPFESQEDCVRYCVAP